MKYFQFILKAFLAGAAFTFGAFIVITYIIPLFVDYDVDSLYRDEIVRVEDEVGQSCLELHSEAVEFAKNDIGEIINQGLKGEDWIAVITHQQKIFIDKAEEALATCMRAEYSARKLNKDWPEFRDLHLLYSSLKVYATSYGKGPASSRDLKPQALDKLIFDYQNVTSLGKGRS